MTDIRDKHRNPDGTYDGIGLLSELSGISKAEGMTILEQVQQNQAKLKICKRHEFEELVTAPPGRGKYRCRHCRGEIDGSAFRWFTIGRQMA